MVSFALLSEPRVTMPRLTLPVGALPLTNAVKGNAVRKVNGFLPDVRAAAAAVFSPLA